MLISDVILSGRALADTPGSSFYTDAEALRAVNNAYADMYSRLTQENDDYFVTMVGPSALTLTPVTDWENMYQYALPSTFYRLRLVKYLGGNIWQSAEKMSLEDLGNSQRYPAYRLAGQALWIYDPGYPRSYSVWYYPQPATLTLATDLTYPQQALPEILSYQVAIEIRRKQNIPVDTLESRKGEMVVTMIKALTRDEFKAQPIQNVFSDSLSPWR